MTLTIKLDGNWSSFQLANNTPPLSVTGSVIAPSARIAAKAKPRLVFPMRFCWRGCVLYSSAHRKWFRHVFLMSFPLWTAAGADNTSVQHCRAEASARPPQQTFNVQESGVPARTTSQCSLQSAPIFRLLLKVAVKGTHQCDFFKFL